MPRNYRKRLGARPYSNYDPKYLELAVEAVKSKRMTIRGASEQYAIPKSTLANKVKQLHMLKTGGQPALSEVHETHLVEGILQCSKWGFPLTPLDIKLLVKSHFDRHGVKIKCFPENMPGNDWLKSFLKRHSRELSLRLSENIKRARAEVSKEVVSEYFQELQQSLVDVDPSNIYNFDETNFSDDPGRVKVVVKRSSKHADRLLDSSKACISVMFAGSATGELLPPYVCYKSDHIWDCWTRNGPTGTRYNRTKSGWFDQCVFEDWFTTILLPKLKKKTGKKLVICDNLASHLSVYVINECKKNDINFVLLPPNSTHLLQPLDVAYFKSLKSGWRETLTTWKKKNRGVLPKDQFPALLKTTLHDIGVKGSRNLISGFAASGIHPFDPQRVLNKVPDAQPNADVSANWTDSFVEILKETRFPSNKKERVKRKKLQVKPGRSVGLDDEENEQLQEELNEIVNDENEITEAESDENEVTEEPESYKPRTSAEVPKNGYDESESEPEVSEIAEEFSEDEVSDSKTITLNKEIAINDFVITKFSTGKKKDLKFVGKIIEINNNNYKTDFLRPNSTKNDVFVYPNVKDTLDITRDQIIFILKPPRELRRGRFQFNKAVF